jgi:hypothetical protein
MLCGEIKRVCTHVQMPCSYSAYTHLYLHVCCINVAGDCAMWDRKISVPKGCKHFASAWRSHMFVCMFAASLLLLQVCILRGAEG